VSVPDEWTYTDADFWDKLARGFEAEMMKGMSG
jgi:hypothetical protein